ncbi:MAG TPA: ABC transporter permease subunit, partial [Deinococcales bacterium]|nr:ABC transporter permease subunit [Deinococcales bacterium]
MTEPPVVSSSRVPARPARKGRGARGLSNLWLPVVFMGPFIAYTIAFLFLPAGAVLVAALTNDTGGFTLSHLASVAARENVLALKNSVSLSAVTALVGVVSGLLLAYAAVGPGAPGWLRAPVTAFSGVAANFAGVPLALAFVATLGTTGMVTRLLSTLGVNLYAGGFSLFSFAGLVVVYSYFQIPLMVIVVTPALDGLKLEWREAAENLGASSWDYWRHIGLPVLTPSLLAAALLLFGNAFAAYATPYALTSGILALLPLQIG